MRTCFFDTFAITEAGTFIDFAGSPTDPTDPRTRKMPTLNWTPTQSSMISAYAYDDPSQELHVEWRHNASRGVYEGVSADEFASLAQSPSVGRFINSDIKPTHNYRREG